MKAQKWIRRVLYALGFVFQYIVPIVLFGGVVPYTHDQIAAGLTKAGYFAFALIFLILLKKVKAKIEAREPSVMRGVLLSVSPIGIWALVDIGIRYVDSFVDLLSIYWGKVLIFIILGRLCNIIAEGMEEHTRKDVTKNET